MTPRVNLIVAVSENMGIGSKGQLPWKLKKELQYFGSMTRRISTPGKRNAVIMGRRTWESIPDKYRPLSERLNVVLTSQPLKVPEGVNVERTLISAISNLGEDVENAWIVGGSSVYQEALEKEFCERLYVTRIFRSYDCDVFFPSIGPQYVLTIDPDVPDEVQTEEGISYKFEVYQLHKS